jgi:dTDP-4-dehydrorhamnose 3,5-epimerase
MGFRIESRHLGDVAVIVPDVYHDERGYFLETYHAAKFRDLGLPGEYVQDNQSLSSRGVVRGLHFQWDPPMGKLMRVTHGSAFLVAIDLRKNSPTMGKWFGIESSEENQRIVWAPAGFARGVCITSETARIQYKCTAPYNADGESALRFDDPDLKIAWPPMKKYTLSDKDRDAMSYAQWLASPLADKFRL